MLTGMSSPTLPGGGAGGVAGLSVVSSAMKSGIGKLKTGPPKGDPSGERGYLTPGFSSVNKGNTGVVGGSQKGGPELARLVGIGHLNRPRFPPSTDERARLLHQVHPA